jgi:sigma-B regulation protein RsbQ
MSSTNTLLFSDVFNFFPNTFQSIISHFEERYRVILYTDSGFNAVYENREIRHNSLNGYADDMIKWLEANNFRNIIYIAHSVNGLLAMIAAVKAPHLFSKIILTSTAPSLLYDPEKHYTCGFEAGKLNELFNQLIQKHDDRLHYHVKSTVQLTDILSRAFSDMSIKDAHSVFNIIFSTDCRTYLSEFSIPTMILQVSSDRFSTHEAGYFMYRNIPDSCLVRIKAKGQLPHVESPEELTLAINFFMNSPVS